jgi:hypothetical protein
MEQGTSTCFAQEGGRRRNNRRVGGDHGNSAARVSEILKRGRTGYQSFVWVLDCIEKPEKFV